MYTPSKRIFLAAVLVVAAATAVSAATELEVAKVANAISHNIDLSTTNANIVANVNKLMRRVHVRGSTASVVRGRSLAQTALCDYDHGECTPGKAAMENFRPETPEGQVRREPEAARRSLPTTRASPGACRFDFVDFP